MKDFTPNNHQKLETVVEKVDSLSVEVEEWKQRAINMKSRVDTLMKISAKEVAKEFWKLVQSDENKGYITTLVQTPDGQIIELGIKPKEKN